MRMKRSAWPSKFRELFFVVVPLASESRRGGGGLKVSSCHVYEAYMGGNRE